MALTTRKPTGRPSWPILLLAGREKAGKSWAAITASASPLIGRTLYVGIGEDDPDEYSLIPGAEFDIVVHDGTYPGILQAITDAVNEPAGELPTLIVVDSMTRLWNLIGDNMQAVANQRAKGRRNPNGDYTISADLWNVAASQWQDVMDTLRTHMGPVILTARLDSVAVMENGQPTSAKEWKIQGHKSLPFDAAAIVEMRERGQYLLTGVKSVRVQLPRPEVMKDFTVDALWDRLGFSEGTGDRTHAQVTPDSTGAEPAPPLKARAARALTAIRDATDLDKLEHVWGLVPTELRSFKDVVTAHDQRLTELGATIADSWATVDIPTDPKTPDQPNGRSEE